MAPEAHGIPKRTENPLGPALLACLQYDLRFILVCMTFTGSKTTIFSSRFHISELGVFL